MRAFLKILFQLFLLLVGGSAPGQTILVERAVSNERLSARWLQAIASRVEPALLDSMSSLRRNYTTAETAWLRLLETRAGYWGPWLDSLAVPFVPISLPDTILVMAGYSGSDDGFTFQGNTVCFDLTALQDNYGDAADSVNLNRIDRLFAHEFTHLLHKEWARATHLRLTDFRDSILWECIYEGIGMYRSLTPKWLPVNGQLPPLTEKTLQELYPRFRNRIGRIQSGQALTEEEKQHLHKNLSRGQVHQKWGALPVAIWLSLEAAGEDRNLQRWIRKGPEGVLDLARKYLGDLPTH